MQAWVVLPALYEPTGHLQAMHMRKQHMQQGCVLLRKLQSKQLICNNKMAAGSPHDHPVVLANRTGGFTVCAP
jgi:hypothetical protein